MRHFLDKIGYPTIAAVLATIIGGAIIYHFGWFSPAPSATVAPPPVTAPPVSAPAVSPPAENRPLIPRTLQELMHIGENKMSVERERLLSPYLGQPIKVSVEV
jgi:hypothetical protein